MTKSNSPSISLPCLRKIFTPLGCLGLGWVVTTKPYRSHAMTIAVDNWPAYARLVAVAAAGQLSTAPTPLPGTQPPPPPSGLIAAQRLLWQLRA